MSAFQVLAVPQEYTPTPPLREGSEAFESLPVAIRNLGPWTDPVGEVERLRLPYRPLLGEQGFVLLHRHVSQLELEARKMRSQVDNRPCPHCDGTGNVDQHGTLRQKNCWRCRERGWLRAPIK